MGVLSGGGTYVGLTDPSGTELTLVLETMTHDLSGCVHEDAPTGPVTAQQVTFTLGEGFSHITSLFVFHSSFVPSASLNFTEETPLAVVNGTVTLGEVQPGSLYTLSTIRGMKGTYATPPASAPFPLPYRDDFDNYSISAPPRYITDQSG